MPHSEPSWSHRRLIVVCTALVAAGIAALPALAYLAPGVSKEVTEERQAEITERGLEVAEDRLLVERRIADSLERIATALERRRTADSLQRIASALERDSR